MKLRCWTARVFVLGLMCQSALAQEIQSVPKPRYAVFDYMKVAPEKAEAYVEIEQKVWKPVHEARLKDGLIIGWRLFRVDNPPGQARDYSFVTVNIVDSFAKLENPYPEKYFSNVSAEDLQKTAESRELIRSEVWRMEDSALAALPEDPFILVDYMEPTAGSEAEYFALETDVWKRIHEARIKGNLMNAWFMMGRMFPGGSQTPYQIVTLNVFPTREAASDPSTGQVVEQVVAGMTDEQRALLNRTEALRTIVREDIWKRIDQVVPQAEQ